MEKYIPEFLRGADNVYRTKYFIVKQTLVIQKSEGEDNLLISYDTYYRRTTKRDLAYNMALWIRVILREEDCHRVHMRALMSFDETKEISKLL